MSESLIGTIGFFTKSMNMVRVLTEPDQQGKIQVERIDTGKRIIIPVRAFDVLDRSEKVTP